jgi:outer membrane protein assembly factor BamB
LPADDHDYRKGMSIVPKLRASLLASALTLSAASALAAPGITLSLSATEPGASVAVTGTGFAASEAVDIYLDTTDEQLTSASATGGFSQALTIPATLPAGGHNVTAVGRTSKKAASASLLVSTNRGVQNFDGSNTANNIYEGVLTPANVSQLAPLWTANLPDPQASLPTFPPSSAFLGSLAVADGALYVPITEAAVELSTTHYGELFAFDALTGKQKWAVKVAPIDTGVAAGGGLVYVAANNTLYALAGATGQKVWSAKVATPPVVDGPSTYGWNAAPQLQGGVLYFPGADGRLTAFNAATGKKLWAATAAGAGVSFLTTPAVANGLVYAGASDGALYEINAATGKIVKSAATGATGIGQGQASPVLYGTEVIDLSLPAAEAFATAGLTPIWSNSENPFPVAVIGNLGYAANFGNQSLTIDMTTGAVTVMAGANCPVDSPYVKPIAANGVIFHRDYVVQAPGGKDGFWGSVVACNRSGAYLSSANLGPAYSAHPLTAPVVANGILYAVSDQDDTNHVAHIAAFSLNGKPPYSEAAPAAPRLSDLHPDYRLRLVR